ncbi:MAG: response regulator, partial [Oscillospiraceae bacterium]|nr:response regulator [Oscillospiraceae bacterium]
MKKTVGGVRKEEERLMGRETVLVVDDDREITRAIRVLLTQEGYEVCTASDGQEALEILGREEIRLIVLDVMMPRLDGLSATLRI